MSRAGVRASALIRQADQIPVTRTKSTHQRELREGGSAVGVGGSSPSGWHSSELSTNYCFLPDQLLVTPTGALE